MATITKGTTFTSGDVVTPAKLNNLVDLATVTLANDEVTTAKIADGAVTSAKLGNDIVLVPAGAIMPFAMNSAPTGWLVANGTAVSRSTYATLFAAIGTTYGAGNGSTTFTLPDLRGYFIRGYGTNSDGTASGAFGAKQADAVTNHTHSIFIPNHQHNIAANVTGSTVSYSSINITGSQYLAARAQSGGSPDWSYTLRGTSSGATLGLTSLAGGGTFTSANPSTGSATETRPANIALLYCIKF